MRKFLVDVTLSFPKGSGIEDWSYIGHLFLDVDEGYLQRDCENAGLQIATKISEWVDKHPESKVHDCMDYPVQTEDEYFCGLCGKELTSDVEDLLTLSSERKVNERATNIVRE